MLSADLTRLLEQAAHDVLLWIGFGTVVGLFAKAIMPGRDPGGAVATLLMGIVGCIIGSGVLMYFKGSNELSPISVVGFLAGTGGSLLLLIFYRILSGAFITEAEDGEQLVARRNRKRRREVLMREGN